jgi:hypothetical protein
VIRLSASLIIHQTAFVDDESLSRMIKCCCKRIVRGPTDQLGTCLALLEAVFEHCTIASSELFLLITTLCFIVCLDIEAERSWKLFSSLLKSEHSHAMLKILQNIMRSFVLNASEEHHDVAVQITRGAVHGLSMAMWGVNVSFTNGVGSIQVLFRK